jgi:Cu/Zn superoxide dismutase
MRHIAPLAWTLALAACLLVSGAASAAEIQVKLAPQNNSGESGTATLSDTADGKTKVVVAVDGAPATAQPMHIHKGTCANLEARPTYGLPALTAGKSEAVIDTTLANLQADKFAINGHKSAQEASVYVFCGEIPGK